jgi:NAD(P)-dependent dehydrogenase (short-subunit alcohol dehydrogenase family)
MAKVLAVEWELHGIRVNVVAPGYVCTPIIEDLQRRSRLDIGALERRTPMGHFIETREAAGVAAILASHASGSIMGQIVGVDGGRIAYGDI